MEELKKEAVPEETAPTNTESLPPFRGKVKLHAYMLEKGIKGADIAETLQEAGYDRCNKSTVSMVANGERYAVTFLPSAWQDIFATHGEPAKRRRKEKRSKPCKLTVRLTKAEHEAFLTVKPQDMTAQDFLHDLIMKEIMEHVDL